MGFANAVVARFGIFSMVGGESGAGRPRVLSSLRRNIVGGSRQRRRVEAVGQISGAVVRWSWWDFQRRLQGGLARRLKRLRLQAMIARIRICRMVVVGRKLEAGDAALPGSLLGADIGSNRLLAPLLDVASGISDGACEAAWLDKSGD